MEKKVFIPSMENLETMEYMNVNVSNYLAAKVVEIILMEGEKYPNKDYFKGEYKYIRENPTIAHSVGLLRPEAIKYSEIAKYDTDLCLKLLDRNYISSDNLDLINYFSDSVLDNRLVIQKVIELLYNELDNNPNYRFNYVENKLLNSIFEGKFNYNALGLGDYSNYNLIWRLSSIEPHYALMMDKNMFSFNERKILLEGVMQSYIDRYDITSYDLEPIYNGVIHKPSRNTESYLKRIRTYKKDNNLR